MLSNSTEISEIFECVGRMLDRDVQALIIGGAALMEYGIKDATKDIDIVCWDRGDNEKLVNTATQKCGFKLVGPEKRHENLNLERISIKGKHSLDIFTRNISGGFRLSRDMWSRANKRISFGKLEFGYASLEDIFIMKAIAKRPGDLEDCKNLITSGLNFDTIYSEIESQYIRVKKELDDGNIDDNDYINENLWISHLYEAVEKIETDDGVTIPISKKVHSLANDYNMKWSDWYLIKRNESKL